MPAYRLGLLALCVLNACPLPARAGDKAPKSGEVRSIADLAKDARASVVVITFTGRDGKQQGLGSGFVVSADGLIATNMHVIGEARPIRVKLEDGKEYPVSIVQASDRTLDLALLKIDAKGLKPLDLGDSDSVKTGLDVVTLGHPQGLKYSVVGGVISGRPNIDGREMLQIAMPIEPGNSGGPLLDRQGRVQGIVTLRSQVTDNLGFAMPVNALKKLVSRPNPIPIARWITIGTLNADEWLTVFEGRWRQRNGSIFVEGDGTDFAGRALCLARGKAPKLPYEIAVTLKLDDEAGAGGLVFHANGDDKHYGFYPSAGKLRFTRFDGPTVFTWKVLWNEASEHYKPGDWNTLKARVTKERIQCYVNDQLVFETTDDELTAGAVGLCKFRKTAIEFKRFQVADKVPVLHPSPTLLAKVDKLGPKLPVKGLPSSEAIDSLLPDAPASLQALRQKAKLLEEQAVQMRELARAIHQKRVLAELVKVIGKEDFDLIHAGLLIAWLDNEDLDVAAYRQQVDRLARAIEASLPAKADEQARLAALKRELFEQRGFHGSRADYYNRANSYLNQVLDDREGLPLTLSILYIELGRRLGLKLEGVGLPGHFIVQHRPTKGQPVLLDVYEGATVMTRADAERKVRSIGRSEPAEAHFKPVTHKMIALRMLYNLASVARGEEDLRGVLRYHDAILTIAPELKEERLIRAGARWQLGDRPGALADVEHMLEHATDDAERERILKLRQLLMKN